MTAAAAFPRSDSQRPHARVRGPRRSSRSGARSGAPLLSPRLQVVRAALVLVFVLSAALLIQLTVVSSLQERAAQGRAFDTFRSELANGTAPIGPTDEAGHELPLGTPVAYIEIPSIGVKQVVSQGTTSSVLFNGPGHRRDTPLPGQVGVSVLFGRRAAFGGPFADIASLTKGALIKVTTGYGVFNFRVLDVRGEGAPAPPAPAAGAGRLMLVTATGGAFRPDGVVRVDAELVSKALIGAAPVVNADSLPGPERIMAGDGRTLWAMALWLQALIALSIAGVWAWHRWGHAQAWVVFLPPLMFVGLAVSGEAAHLLPNLL